MPSGETHEALKRNACRRLCLSCANLTHKKGENSFAFNSSQRIIAYTLAGSPKGEKQIGNYAVISVINIVVIVIAVVIDVIGVIIVIVVRRTKPPVTDIDYIL